MRMGVVTKFIYDSLDRLIQKIENFISGGAVNSETNVSTKYFYDLHGNLVKTINPRGFSTTFSYDAAHRSIIVTDANGKTVNLSYDKVDNLLNTNDRNSHNQLYSYDNLDRLIKYTNAEGHFETYSYDKVGNETAFVNARGKTFTQQFDPLNRVKVAIDPFGETQASKYDPAGNLLSFTDENSHTDNFAYDKVYRLITGTDAEGFDTNYTYDQNGNITILTDGNSNPTKYTYDQLDRSTNILNAESEESKFGYDALENITLETEADGTQHKFDFDPLYRLSEVTNNFKSGGAVNNDTNVSTDYSYDANGNLTQTINPLSNPTTFGYDRLDRLTSEVNPLGNTWNYGYDFEGNLTSRNDANGDVTSYAYYSDDILKTINYPTYSVNYLYGKTNFPTQMSDNLGVTSWGYDDLDRLTSQDDSFSRNISYNYDPVGNLTKLIYPDSRFVSHSYLKNDWLSRSTSSDNDSKAYTRDKVGNTVRSDMNNSTYSTIAYDKVYRPLQVHDQQVGFGDHLIHDFKYTYNDVGDITKEEATYGWRQPAGVTTDFGYDGLHRLTQSTDTDDNLSGYTYDAAGNRTIQTESIKNKGTETRAFDYNSANQLLQIDIDSPMPPNVVVHKYQYDANGNRTDKLVEDGTGVDRGTRYLYDFENRLTQAQDYQGEIVKNNKDNTENYTVNDLSVTDLEYDGNGRRLAKTYSPGASQPGKRTEYVFDRLDSIVEYSMWNGQRNNMYRDSEQNLIFFQEFKSEQAPSGTNYFYHYDGEGNISATTKHQGQSDHTYRFDEYGAVMPENGNWLEPHNEYALSQKEYDSNTDLYYFGARHYDALTGTWMTQDSYRGEIQDPMSLHRYMYNFSSPVNYTDTYGFEAFEINVRFMPILGGEFKFIVGDEGKSETRFDFQGGLGLGAEVGVKYYPGSVGEPTSFGYLRGGLGGKVIYGGSIDSKSNPSHDYREFEVEAQIAGLNYDNNGNAGSGIGAHIDFLTVVKEGLFRRQFKTPKILDWLLWGSNKPTANPNPGSGTGDVTSTPAPVYQNGFVCNLPGVFGIGSYNVINGYSSRHTALDLISGGSSQNVYAVSGGTVQFVNRVDDPNKTLRNQGVLSVQTTDNLGDVYTTKYVHTNSSLRPGDQINNGALIGNYGPYGAYNGTEHLHLSVDKNGVRIDPRTVSP